MNERKEIGGKGFYVLYVSVLCDVVTSAGDLWLFVNAHRSVEYILGHWGLRPPPKPPPFVMRVY